MQHATNDHLVTIRARLVIKRRARLTADGRAEDLIGYVTALEARGVARSALGWVASFRGLFRRGGREVAVPEVAFSRPRFLRQSTIWTELVMQRRSSSN